MKSEARSWPLRCLVLTKSLCTLWEVRLATLHIIFFSFICANLCFFLLFFFLSLLLKKVISLSEYPLFVPDFATFRGNNKIRAMMQQPGGVCVAAAEGSGGSVFNGNKWVTSKAVRV